MCRHKSFAGRLSGEYEVCVAVIQPKVAFAERHNEINVIRIDIVVPLTFAFTLLRHKMCHNTFDIHNRFCGTVQSCTKKPNLLKKMMNEFFVLQIHVFNTTIALAQSSGH